MAEPSTNDGDDVVELEVDVVEVASSDVVVGSGDDVIIFRTSDGLAIPVEMDVALRCGAVRRRLKNGDMDDDNGMIFDNVSGAALVRVIDYCRYEWPGDFHNPPVHSPDRTQEEQKRLSKQHEEKRYPKNLGYGGGLGTIGSIPRPKATAKFETYLAKADPAILCELASASYYLDVKPLVDLTCRAIADTIKGKSPEEIRTTFNIVNDFTPTEEEQVRRSVLQRTLMLPAAATAVDDFVSSGTAGNTNALTTELLSYPTGNPTRDKLRNKLLRRRQRSRVASSRAPLLKNDKDEDIFIHQKKEITENGPKVTTTISTKPPVRKTERQLRSRNQKRKAARERAKLLGENGVKGENSGDDDTLEELENKRLQIAAEVERRKRELQERKRSQLKQQRPQRSRNISHQAQQESIDQPKQEQNPQNWSGTSKKKKRKKKKDRHSPLPSPSFEKRRSNSPSPPHSPSDSPSISPSSSPRSVLHDPNKSLINDLLESHKHALQPNSPTYHRRKQEHNHDYRQNIPQKADHRQSPRHLQPRHQQPHHQHHQHHQQSYHQQSHHPQSRHTPSRRLHPKHRRNHSEIEYSKTDQTFDGESKRNLSVITDHTAEHLEYLQQLTDGSLDSTEAPVTSDDDLPPLDLILNHQNSDLGEAVQQCPYLSHRTNGAQSPDRSTISFTDDQIHHHSDSNSRQHLQTPHEYKHDPPDVHSNLSPSAHPNVRLDIPSIMPSNSYSNSLPDSPSTVHSNVLANEAQSYVASSKHSPPPPKSTHSTSEHKRSSKYSLNTTNDIRASENKKTEASEARSDALSTVQLSPLLPPHQESLEDRIIFLENVIKLLQENSVSAQQTHNQQQAVLEERCVLLEDRVKTLEHALLAQSNQINALATSFAFSVQQEL